MAAATDAEERELSASEFARKQLGFEPDEMQTAVLDSVARRGILNCTRQWGKSTVLAAKAVHRAWTRPGVTVLVASPSLRQSGEFIRKAAEFLRRLDVKRRGDGDNASSLLLPNGSRIVGLPGSEATVRGFSAVSLLLIDEAARVTDAMYLSLRPMLVTSGGEIWLMSTPWGERGFFYDTWTHGKGWEQHMVRATECPRIPADVLEEEREAMGKAWFRQEYLCEFLGGEEGWFRREDVEAAFSEVEDAF